MYLLQRALILVLGLSLFGCDHSQPSYEYLMQHPDLLRQAALSCEKADASSSYCEIVMYAATNAQTMLTQQQSDPERFGERILETQMALAKTRDDIQSLEQSIKQPTDDKLVQLKKMEADASQELMVMLAIVGINSPD
jgi:septal ring factor EnvC (AmiA/AmiB activator)